MCFGACLGLVTLPLRPTYGMPARRSTASTLPPKGVPVVRLLWGGAKEITSTLAAGSPCVGSEGSSCGLVYPRNCARAECVFEACFKRASRAREQVHTRQRLAQARSAGAGALGLRVRTPHLVAKGMNSFSMPWH